MAFLVMSISTWLNINFPHCVVSIAIETAFRVIIIIVALITIFIFICISTNNSSGKFYFVILFFLFGITILSTNYRHEMLKKYHWKFQGLVSKKFESRDHETKTMTIEGIDYKLLPSELWSNIKVGYFLMKESCSRVVVVNKDEKLDILN